MAVIRPFECVRPQTEKAERVAALPYDVYNREEACREVAREPLSFLKIDRAETQFDSSVDTYAPEVYAKAKELLENAIPCHRVVNSAGRTAPHWTEQRPMLEAEGVRFRKNGCVDLTRSGWKEVTL